MILYVAFYAGDESKNIVRKTLRLLGKDPKVVLIDVEYDIGALELKRELSTQGYDVHIEPFVGSGFYDYLNHLNQIRIQNLSAIADADRDSYITYYEVGMLDFIKAGAMFVAASNVRCRAVYIDDGNLITIEYQELPDVRRVSYTSMKVMTIIAREETVSYKELADLFYAEQIEKLDSEGREEFLKTHHNLYKVIEALIGRGWVSQDRMKKYQLTPLGMTAKMRIDAKDY